MPNRHTLGVASYTAEVAADRCRGLLAAAEHHRQIALARRPKHRECVVAADTEAAKRLPRWPARVRARRR